MGMDVFSYAVIGVKLPRNRLADDGNEPPENLLGPYEILSLRGDPYVYIGVIARWGGRGPVKPLVDEEVGRVREVLEAVLYPLDLWDSDSFGLHAVQYISY